jgi:hypothetical protein
LKNEVFSKTDLCLVILQKKKRDNACIENIFLLWMDSSLDGYALKKIIKIFILFHFQVHQEIRLNRDCVEAVPVFSLRIGNEILPTKHLRSHEGTIWCYFRSGRSCVSLPKCNVVIDVRVPSVFFVAILQKYCYFSSVVQF